MTATKLDLDAILNEPNVLTQEELNIFGIDYILESTDTETELDETLIDIDFDEPISITTSTENPLDKQLKALTCDGYSLADWMHAERTEDYVLLKHIDTGLIVKWMLKK
jgi:hypothetical protein